MSVSDIIRGTVMIGLTRVRGIRPQWRLCEDDKVVQPNDRSDDAAGE